MTTVAEDLGLDARWQRAFATIERLVGGRVVRAERQDRWRPAWYLDVDLGGEIAAVYFRGDRGLGEGGAYALEHELSVLQLLEAQGIPVPHVFGFCEDPRGIVMARAPGRANLATAVDESERRAVLDHYVDILLEIHRLDPAIFEKIGLRSPESPEARALADLPIWEKGYRQAKRRPEPLIEFVLGWLRRNAPTHRTRTAFLCGDSGQFLFEDGRVTAVIDLELAYVGDPLADLGGMRCRDLSEPLGDLDGAFRRYAEGSGEPVDRDVVHYHTARFALVTPLAVAGLCASPPPGLNLVQYLGWYLVYGRIPLEVIAELRGFTLAPPELPDADPSPNALVHDALVGMLQTQAGDYEIDAALRVAQYAREIDRLGPRLQEQDLDDVGALLGRRPVSAKDADTRLESFVQGAGADLEVELVRLLHRRSLRQEALLRPALRELVDAHVQRIGVLGAS